MVHISWPRRTDEAYEVTVKYGSGHSDSSLSVASNARPRDVNALARVPVDEATGERPKYEPGAGKDSQRP